MEKQHNNALLKDFTIYNMTYTVIMIYPGENKTVPKK